MKYNRKYHYKVLIVSLEVKGFNKYIQMTGRETILTLNRHYSHLLLTSAVSFSLATSRTHNGNGPCILTRSTNDGRTRSWICR